MLTIEVPECLVLGELPPLLSIIDVLLLRFLPLWSPKARHVQSCCFTPKTMSCPLGCCLLLWSSLDPSLQSVVVLLTKQSIIAKHLGKFLGHSLSQPPLRNTCGTCDFYGTLILSQTLSRQYCQNLETNAKKFPQQNANLHWLSV